MLISDEQIAEISVDLAARHIVSDIDFARAIEAAVLEAQKQKPVKFLLDGARFKLSFQEVQCGSCGEMTDEMRCVPLDAYAKELQGEWIALVPAANDQHLRMAAPVVQPGMVKPCE